MKRNYIVRLLLFLAIGVSLAACQRNEKGSGAAEPTHAVRDTSLNYLLKPVNEQVIARIPLIRAQKGSSIYMREVQGRVTYDTRNQITLASRVSGRIEKLHIKYNYQPVKKGQLIMEIYSPDLAAAQRELLLIQQSGDEDGMLQSAKQRLMLLGMDQRQISKVLRTGQVNYTIPVYSNATGFILEKQAASAVPSPAPMSSPAASTGMDNMASGSATQSTQSSQTAPTEVNSAVMIREGQYLNAGQNIFTIYRTGDLVVEFSLSPSVVSKLNKQAKVLIQRTANKKQTLTGKIGLIQPVFNAGENFVIARVYLKSSGLQPGELVTGQIPFVTEKGLWLPKEAVVSIGNQSVVFKKEGRVFIPKTVKTGIIQNNKIQVFGELSEWDLAKNAYYLIDSESFIKTLNKGV
ncbi:efflux RND transporter periplasmic adaptor subunit [Pedobacter immunditicola]|uniref:efflux RND transporter periplasmic adaptor subunit n=1 Tax=Pedobacter immunditicola TaxID=3133440 RepID=UPI0030ABBDCF